MSPPSSHTLRTLSGAHLSQWKVNGSFASAAECEQARVRPSQADSPANLRNAKQQLLKHSSSNAQCVASDAPRLHSQ
jgi:hypothetical protein